MSEKILLIDGHSILNRAYYGLPNLTNWEGLHTNAVYGFLNIMTKVLEEEKPEYLAVAFDLHAPTFRHKMYDAYKGTRKPMPEELREQVPLIKEVLTAMGVAIVTKEGYEADDLLGTIAGMAEKKGMDATILSGDRDLLQLATDHVLIRIPKTKGGKTEVEDYHAKEVLETYQVTPPQIIELKALMGDTADNIPGIPGVGEKTATKIIAAYGSIENAHEHLEEIKPNKAKESLRDHYDLAVLSKKLATIDTESPVEFSWEAARMGSLYTPEAYDYFKRLEFKNLLSRFDQQETEQKELPSWRSVEDFAEAENIWNQAEQSAQAGVAVVDGMEGIRGVAVAMEDQEVVYFPVEGFQTEGVLCGHLERLFAGSSEIGAWDVKSIRKKIEIPERKGIFDLGIGAYLMNPLKSDYTYDDVAKEYLGEQLPSQEEVFSGMKKPDPKKADNEQAAAYGAYQAYVALHGKDALKKALQKAGMWNLFEEIEMPLVFTLDDMEKEGILVKGEELKLYGEKLEVRIRELEEKIYEEAGETFNINSPKQLGVILFEKMQMPGGKKTKTGYSTAADVLDKLAPDYPFVADILEYRQLTKLKSTYADGLAGYIGEDGRIHSTFNQTITATGRISSTEPNLQNIPVRMELGRLIRKVFVPRDGFVFLDADYSQIELRVLAHLSGDEMLIKAYREAQDIHRMTASQVFHIPFDEVTPLQRRNAKAVNFGIVYGISSFGLSQDLSITRKEAADYIEKYFATYPKIKSYLDGEVEKAKADGYSLTMFGRRRPVPELKSSNFMQRSFGERIAMNSPIQGTAADIIKIAMIRVNQALRSEHLRSRLVLQVHDELLIETAKEEVEEVSAILEREMRQAADLSVPLEVDMHTGENWYEAK
ncbi:DNA polymerase I [Blautia sp.]|uniref:DNA polymerase I n=1 Tax=Blautia sp. TaxID=1955243 RepID=UPI00257FF937|nr:DNA polymerase I [Blautia sp.]